MHSLVVKALAAASILAAAAGPAQSAVSTFNGGDDGWVTSIDNGGTATVYAPSGGNPGGYVSLLDADDGWAYFQAPASFLAPVAPGGVLSFDIRHSAPTAQYPVQYGVRAALQGAGLTLITEAGAPTTNWSSQSFSLSAAGGWRIHASLATNYVASNPAPSAAQFAAVLASLTGVYIAADYTNGTALVGVSDITQLDNVALVPEPATALSLAAGLAVLAGLQRRRQRG